MSNAINNFMVGKKKISASVILPIIIAFIQVIMGDNQNASTIIELVQEFAPTLIALVGGISYAVIEGVNDNTRIKATNGATSSGAGIMAPTASNNGNGGVITSPIGQPGIAIPELAPAWDMAAFDKKVKEKAPLTYGASTPSTELYQALTMAQAEPCHYIEHAVAFWDYATMKADARFTDVWGYSFREATEKVSEPGCPKCPSACGSLSSLKHKALNMGEGFYTSYLDYERVSEKSRNVQVLAQYARQGFNWKQLPSIYMNLYYVGEMAANLLATIKT